MNPDKHMIGAPYRSTGNVPHPTVRVRASWLRRLWWRWQNRRCLRGDHYPGFDMDTLRPIGKQVFLRCTRCNATRDLESYGPLAFRATGWWSEGS